MSGVQIHWGLGANMPNPGEAFAVNFERQRQIQEQNALRQAYSDVVRNPGDPQAINALAGADPQMALRLQQQQAQMAQQQQDRTLKVIGNAAKAATDPQKWDAIIDQLAQRFPEAAQYKGRFDPALRAAIMAEAGVSDDAAQAPSFIREADALGIPRDRARQLWEQKQGTVVIGGVPYMAAPAQGAPQAAAPPPQAVEFLRQNPALANDFDAKYGPGAAARALGEGGPGPSGPVPF